MTMRSLSLVSLFIVLSACHFFESDEKPRSPEATPDIEDKLDPEVLTQYHRDSLTPHDVIQRLKNGNDRFVQGKRVNRDWIKQVKTSQRAEFPMAVILSDIDARVPAEIIFDQGLGTLMNVRVAGNYASREIIGSLEYACKEEGAKVLVVLGHSDCAVIKSAIRNERYGNLGRVYDELEASIKSTYNGGKPKNVEDQEFVEKVCIHNVDVTISKIEHQSPILRDLEEEGRLVVIGAVYDLGTGEVYFLEKW